MGAKCGGVPVLFLMPVVESYVLPVINCPVHAEGLYEYMHNGFGIIMFCHIYQVWVLHMSEVFGARLPVGD